MDREASAEVESFLDQHQYALSRLAMALTLDRESAEELLQETFVRLAVKWRQVRQADHRLAYAKRLLCNTHIDLVRKQRSTSRLPHDMSALADGGMSAVDERLAIAPLLKALPERQRAALALRYLDDLSDADVAAILGCRESTVRSLVKRGLDTIKRGQLTQTPPGKDRS